MAVFPQDDVKHEEVSSLEQFAAVSNSEMVYACDEFGNKIAVGVIVSNSFDVSPTNEDISKIESSSCIDLDQSANGSWVGAMEECATEEIENIQTDEQSQPKDEIRVYKVQKGKPKQKFSGQKQGRKLKTLAEIKKSRNVSAPRKILPFVQKRLKPNRQKKSGQEPNMINQRKLKRRKKKQDKCYPAPSRIRHAHVDSMTLFHICKKCISNSYLQISHSHIH